ncbi:MAG: pectinesterase [Chthoniobacter sp.]|jgi:pectinesterase|nr:pectinesterase [Chthoniobacter sp.]
MISMTPSLLSLRNPISGLCSFAFLFLSCADALAEGKRITVSAEGDGDYKTVQEAIAAVPDNSQETSVIHIKAGIYQGPVIVPATKSNVTLEGDDTEKTVITWDRNVKDPIPEGANKFNPCMHVLADNFRAEKLTIQNTSGDHGQALALRIDGDRIVLKNCRLLGWQDTLMINKGRQYFKDCYIEGRVDFIYGDGTAVFDHCEIKSKNGGHITAASTPQEHPYGFVFMECKLTGDPAPWVDPTGAAATPKPSSGPPMADLGRPWRPYGSVTYLNCEMGDHIKPEGWNNWSKPENETTARYAEYNTRGPGAHPDKRAPWTKQLTKEEAEKITLETVLGGTDGWKPE